MSFGIPFHVGNMSAIYYCWECASSLKTYKLTDTNKFDISFAI